MSNERMPETPSKNGNGDNEPKSPKVDGDEPGNPKEGQNGDGPGNPKEGENGNEPGSTKDGQNERSPGGPEGLLSRIRYNWLSISIMLDVFLAGVAILVVEIIGGRLLTTYFGSTTYVWGSQIFVVMAALSIGYYLGGRLADKRPDFSLFSTLLLASGGLLFLILIFQKAVLTAVMEARAGPVASPIFGSLILFCAPCVLLGMITPLAIKLKTQRLEGVGSSVGDLYALSTLGSIVGAFISVFVLIPLTTVTNIFFGACILLLLLALLGLDNKLRAVAVAVLVLSVPVYGVVYPPPVLVPVEDSQNVDVHVQKCTNSLLLATGEDFCGAIMVEDTAHQHLSVLDGYTNRVRYLVLDDLIRSAINLNSTQRDEPVYLSTYFMHLPWILNSDIEDVLVIGNGAFELERAYHNSFAESSIDVVEVDSRAVAVGKGLFNLEEDERLRMHVNDGRNFLAGTDKTYDLIALDIYIRNEIPYHLLTLEFLQLAKQHLNPNGVLALNMITSLSGADGALFWAEYHTMQSVFPNVYNFPLEYSNTTIQNVVMLASRDNRHYNADVFRALAVESYQAGRFPFEEVVFYADHYLGGVAPPGPDVPLTDDSSPIFSNPATGGVYVGKPYTGV